MIVHATLNPGHIIAIHVVPTIIHHGGVPGPGTVRSPKAPVLWAPTSSDGGAPPTSVNISVRFPGFVQCFLLPSCRSGVSIPRFISSTGLLPVLLGDLDTQNATVGIYSYLAKRAPGVLIPFHSSIGILSILPGLSFPESESCVHCCATGASRACYSGSAPCGYLMLFSTLPDCVWLSWFNSQ